MKKVILGLSLIGLLSGCQLLPDEAQEQKAIETEETIIERKEITGQLTNSDIYNINAYLSDLGNSGFKSYDKENLDHNQLLNLGFWLYVYDGMDKVDHEEVDGRYYDVFIYEAFNEKINRYFDCELEKKGNDEWLFQDNKYYHPSLDMGYDLNTVIQVNRVFNNGDDSFLVEGSIYRFESSMEYNIYEQYLQPKSTWTTSMDSELIGTASVKFVYSERLNHYVIDEYTSNYLNSNTEISNVEVEEPETLELINYLTSISESAGEELRQLFISLEEGDYETINNLIFKIKEESIPYYTEVRDSTNNQTLISTINLYLDLLDSMIGPDYEYRFTFLNTYDRQYAIEMVEKADEIVKIYEEASGDTYGIGRSQIELIYQEYPFLLGN